MNPDKQSLTVDDLQCGKLAFPPDPIWSILDRDFGIAVFCGPFGQWSYICRFFTWDEERQTETQRTTVLGVDRWTADDAKRAAIAHVNEWLLEKKGAKRK